MYSPRIVCQALACILFNLYSTVFYAQKITDPRVDELVKKARKNTNNADSLFAIGTQTIQYAKTNALPLGEMEGYFMQGYSSYLKGEYDAAIHLFDQGIQVDPELPETHKVGYRLLRNKAVALVRLGHSDSAQVIFKKVVDLTASRNDARNHALALNDFAIDYKNKGEYKTALDIYTDALNIWDSLGVDRYKTSLLLNIGLAQNELDQTQKSIETYRQGLALAKQYKVDRDIYRFYNNLSVNFNSLKQFDSALVYSRRAASFYKKNNSLGPTALAHQNIGKAFMGMQQQDSAQYYLNKAEIAHKQMKSSARIGELFFLKSILFRNRKQYETAIRYSDSAITIFKDLALVGNLKDAYEVRSEILEKNGNYKEANEYLKAVQQLEDVAYRSESNEKLIEIITKYEVKKKDKQIEDLNRERSIYQSTSFLVTLLSIILFAIIILFWIRYKKAKNELALLRDELKNFHEAKTQDKTPSLLHLKSKAVIDINELLYVKSDGHYLEYYTKSSKKPEIDRNTLREIAISLTPQGFAQIHKSYLVNLAQVRIINSTKLMLEDGTWLPLSRTYKPRLKETLLLNG